MQFWPVSDLLKMRGASIKTIIRDLPRPADNFFVFWGVQFFVAYYNKIVIVFFFAAL